MEYVRSVGIPCASLVAPSFSLSVSVFAPNGWLVLLLKAWGGHS